MGLLGRMINGKNQSTLIERAVFGDTLPMMLLERSLAFLRWCSIGHRVRSAVWNRYRPESTNDPRLETIGRYYAGWWLDAYISGWVLLELVVLFALLGTLPTTLLVVLATYRVVEIVQVFGNTVLFDERRSRADGYVTHYMVLAAARSTMHALVLLGETILCFAIIFYAARGSFDASYPIDGAVAALDTSIRTITTVGPAAQAHGTFRLVVDLEPLLGLLFGGTVLARAINALPNVQDTQQALAERPWLHEVLMPPPDAPRHPETPE